MTAPEVEWVLDRIGTVADSVAADYGADIERIDRDESQFYDRDESVTMSEPLPQRKGALERSCYIGAQTADGSETPIGTEYDLDVERVVGLRVEGLHHARRGQVDPTGNAGVPWRNGDDGLVERIRAALYDQRTWPDAGGSNVAFSDLQLTNPADTSSNLRDFYRWDVDVVFDGFETLL